MANTHKEYPSNILANGLLVLELVMEARQKKGVALQEVSTELGFHRSSAYRYLRTLSDCGWLEFDRETNRYRIGIKPLQFTSALLQQLDLRTIARPYLEKLAQSAACLAAHLGVLNESSIVYIDKVESNSPIQMRSRPGMTVPLYCTAMGKAILSTMMPQQVQSILDGSLTERTHNTIIDMPTLVEDLNKVRERGYALDMEENEVGIGCIGAPIYGYANEVIGALSLSTLIQELTPLRIQEFSEKVVYSARHISKKMGWHNNPS